MVRILCDFSPRDVLPKSSHSDLVVSTRIDLVFGLGIHRRCLGRGVCRLDLFEPVL
jgi:hypothetical protein